jgi:hypothetical protein
VPSRLGISRVSNAIALLRLLPISDLSLGNFWQTTSACWPMIRGTAEVDRHPGRTEVHGVWNREALSMQLVTAIVTALSTVTGVAVGGMIALRKQRASHHAALRAATLRDRQEACVDFLAVTRRYRRLIIHAKLGGEPVDPSERSLAVEGPAKSRASMDEAFARLMIVADSDKITNAAQQLATRVAELVRSRVREGMGNIPDDVISACRVEELNFTLLVRDELRS